MYYNTTNETNPELSEYRQKAMTQDGKILHWVEYMHSTESWRIKTGWTPSEVQKHILTKAPLTSVRRSMNTLTKQGKLIKTEQKRQGPYGRPEHVWTLPEAAKQIGLIFS